MRITILDDYQRCISSLEAYQLLKGHTVQIMDQYFSSEEDLIAELDRPEALILNRTRTSITSGLLEALPTLRVISQTGKNAGHIDTKACADHGVEVLEGRGNPIATAELTWALIMNSLRQLPQAMAGIKEGRWQTNIGRRVYGKTIGIWSYGRIGKIVARYANAFGANVLVWGNTNSRQAAHADGYDVAHSKKEFLSTSDVVSLHIRLNPTTQDMISYDDLCLMKDDGIIVNTSRAELIQSGALLRALKDGTPGYAAVDVFREEPIFDANYPLLQMSNVICTPHMGYVEHSSYELYFGIAFQNLLEWIQDSQKN